MLWIGEETLESKTVAIERAYDYNPVTVNKAMDALCADLFGEENTHNPFRAFIEPGMRVFIKPNWVASRWRKSADHVDTLYAVITHENVIEAVADRVAIALCGQGEIVIGDNPSIDADFEELMNFTGIRRLESKYDVPCHIIDMRPLVCDNLDNYGQRDKMVRHRGDPLGEVQVNLGKNSLLHDVDSTLFRGVFNEREETIAAHTGDTQLYTYGRSLYDADVYISIPKLKTHQKVGATLNLKGLVGSITEKNQLVHWRIGSPESGGDEYPDAASLEASKSAKVTHRGAWPGNDTIWRMVADLYKGLQMKPRKYFSVIDGIVAGEGQGPFCPTSKHASVLLAGEDLLMTDIVAVRLMGFDPRKIKYLNYFIESGEVCMPEDIKVLFSNSEFTRNFWDNKNRYLDFKVIPKWECIKM